MSLWQPISDDEFYQLFRTQYEELDETERRIFEKYRVDFWKATIRRSEMYGDEHVNVVAQNENGVLYFDDVEYGFDLSTVDNEGVILTPGGSQASLKEAITYWFTSD